MKHLSFPLIVLLLIFCAAKSPKPRPTVIFPQVPQWEQVGTEINEQLLAEQRNLADWVAEIRHQEPKDLQSALVKVSLMQRMRSDHETALAVRQLGKLLPPLRFETTEDYYREARLQQIMRNIYHHAAYSESWETVLAVLEAFPDRNNFWALEKDGFRKYLRKKGWDENRIIQWLGRMRQRAAGHPWPTCQLEGFRDGPAPDPESFPRSLFHAFTKSPYVFWWRQSRVRPEAFWLALQAKHLQAMGQDKKVAHLLESLEQAIRKHPADLSKIFDYRYVLKELSYGKKEKSKRNLDWIVDVFQPQNSTAAYLAADQLRDFLQPRKLAKLYRYALTTPLERGESVDFPQLYKSFVIWTSMLSLCDMVQCEPPETVRKRYRFVLQCRLSACLAACGKRSESNRLAREAFETVWNSDLISNFPFEDIAPAHWTLEKIEARLLEEETASKADPRYWLKRASFYRRRKRRKEAEYAYRKGLDVAKPARPTPQRLPMTKSIRATLLDDYVKFLNRNQRSQEAIDLLHAELRTAPADTESAMYSADRLIDAHYREVKKNLPEFGEHP